MRSPIFNDWHCLNFDYRPASPRKGKKNGSHDFWEEVVIEPFFILAMRKVHNGYAEYFLAKMLQCSYVIDNGDKFLPIL